jgi:hypothetical protein
VRIAGMEVVTNHSVPPGEVHIYEGMKLLWVLHCSPTQTLVVGSAPKTKPPSFSEFFTGNREKRIL